MCGVAGIFAYHYAAPEVSRDELKTIRDAMIRRGPDGFGEWFSSDGRVALGHRRLSILDLSEKGSQPMASEDGSLVISFNGEIYNYREIRKTLIEKGYRFKSDTDTEVLLYLYREKGEGMFEDLRGMFAFALWDERKKSMLLARDPFGIKPLYYADDGWTARVASQVKALLTSPKVSRIKEPAGIAGFYLLGSVPEPLTLYQEIRSVPAGSYQWIDSTGPQIPKSYFSIAKTWSESFGAASEDPRAFSEVLSQAVTESVRYHFVSDVPVGLFLSSGIDSGALLAFAQDAGYQDVKTLTLAFKEFEGTSQDESGLAEKMARLYGSRHKTRFITPEEIKKELPRFFEAMDQPTIDGLNTYLVSKLAAEEGLKVALSGLGSDELFGGYPSFSDIPKWNNLLKIPHAIPGLGALSRQLLSALPVSRRSPKSAGMIEYGGTWEGSYLLKRGLFMPWELEDLLGKEMAQEGMRRLSLLSKIHNILEPDPKTPFAKVSSMEMSFYMKNQLLRDADWAGMAHSLEIRVPYVDKMLFSTLAPKLQVSKVGNHKKILALSPKKALPAEVVERKKTGFSLPMDLWLQNEKSLDSWKGKDSLRKQGCHWARRWGYEVMKVNSYE